MPPAPVMRMIAHDDQAGVEEDREAEEERGDTERERRTLLPEPVDEGVGEDLGAAGDLEEPPDHGAEADEQGHAGQGRPESAEQRRHDVGVGDLRREGGQQADEDERHEGMDLESHDEQEQQCHRAERDEEQHPRAVGRLDLVSRDEHRCSSYVVVDWDDGTVAVFVVPLQPFVIRFFPYAVGHPRASPSGP